METRKKYTRGHNPNTLANLRRPIVPLVDRIRAKIDMTGGPEACWPWTGGLHGGTQPQVWNGTKPMAATPLWYEAQFGRGRAGLKITRTCETMACMQPLHFKLDTTGSRKGPGFGEKHHSVKLTREKVAEIKQLVRDGVRVNEIAKRYDVTHGAITSITRGLAWKDVA